MSYHYKDSRTSMSLDEPIWLSKFICTWILPPALREKYGSEILTEQINKLSGIDLDKMPSTVEQMYRMSTRRFSGGKVTTNVDLTMDFEVNVDKDGRMYPYNIMKDWCKLIFDPQTGFQTIKRDHVGSLDVKVHTKTGDVIRNVYFPVIFPIKPPASWDLEYNTDNIYDLKMTFAGENPKDVVVGA